MTNPEAQTLENDISYLEKQVRAKKDRLFLLRRTCAHDWGATKRAGFTYVGAPTQSWKRTCGICGDEQYCRVDASIEPSKVFG